MSSGETIISFVTYLFTPKTLQKSLINIKTILHSFSNLPNTTIMPLYGFMQRFFSPEGAKHLLQQYKQEGIQANQLFRLRSNNSPVHSSMFRRTSKSSKGDDHPAGKFVPIQRYSTTSIANSISYRCAPQL